VIGKGKRTCRISQWIMASYPFMPKKDIHSYPKMYPLISLKDIFDSDLEIL
jgi:hypothetical protein